MKEFATQVPRTRERNSRQGRYFEYIREASPESSTPLRSHDFPDPKQESRGGRKKWRRRRKKKRWWRKRRLGRRGREVQANTKVLQTATNVISLERCQRRRMERLRRKKRLESKEGKDKVEI